jgi:outer membrane biosynthesis protein TonB
MGNLKVSDEKFDQKRPDYKEGDDRSMSVTYVTTDWTNKPEVKKPRIIKPKPEVPLAAPTTEPSVEPTTTRQEPKTTELPQPKPKAKPEKIVEPTKAEPQTSEPEQKPEELPQPKSTEKPVANPEEDEENKNLQESIKNIKRLMFT